jgi:hypothetical protein
MTQFFHNFFIWLQSTTALFFAIFVAIVSFQINHRIKRLYDIKVIINSLFELYGNSEVFKDHDPKEANLQISQEILSLEKMHDENRFISREIKKLRDLRMIYLHVSQGLEVNVESEMRKVGFTKLGKSFLILSFFNPRT